MITQSVDELMTAYGFTVKGSCRCDGYETIKYKKDGYVVKWRKYKYQFSIEKGRYLMVSWTSIDKLEIELKKYVALEKQKVA